MARATGFGFRADRHGLKRGLGRGGRHFCTDRCRALFGRRSGTTREPPTPTSRLPPTALSLRLRLPLLNWCGKGPAANVRLASGDDQLGLSDLRFEVQPRLGAKIMLDEAMLPLPDASGGRAAGHLRIWGGSLSPMTGNSAPRGDLSIGAVSPERHTPKRPQLCPGLGPFLRPAAASARRAGPNGQNAGDPSDDDLVHRRRATSTPTRKASACRGACRVQRLRE
jgi:hypothetical protein